MFTTMLTRDCINWHHSSSRLRHNKPAAARETCKRGAAAVAERDPVDVAVIGAGPAGLSAAIAIRKACPGLSVRVLERARQLRPCGGCIGMQSYNAALDAMGPQVLERVAAAAVKRRNFLHADRAGAVYNTIGSETMIISWYDLQAALLSCLPHDIITLGCTLQEVEQGDDGVVTVGMANGARVRARLVVGADGNASVCRAHVQGDNQPAYVGAAVWRLFVPGENPFVEVGDSLVMTDGGKLVAMQATKRDKQMVTYCSGITGFDEARLSELNQTRYVQDAGEDTQALSAKLLRFREQFQGFYPELLAWVLANAVPDAALEHPMFALDPRRPWSRGRLTLCGDSAHVMPPHLAMGTPSAYEDAVQLAASLGAHGISDAALAEYEEVRKARLLPIWDDATNLAMGYYRHKLEDHSPFGGAKTLAAAERILDYRAPSLVPSVA